MTTMYQPRHVGSFLLRAALFILLWWLVASAYIREALERVARRISFHDSIGISLGWRNPSRQTGGALAQAGEAAGGA
jgi:hypothetical protein